MINQNTKIFIAIAIYLIWVVCYSAFNYLENKELLIKDVDQRLVESAMLVPSVLDEGFHKVGLDKNTVSDSEDWRNIIRLSALSETLKVKYVYSLIQHENKILFTSSSATTEELISKKNMPFYFFDYHDSPKELDTIFETGTTQFVEYSDQWGSFRSVFIPLTSRDGLRYVTAADIEISYIEKTLNGLLITSLLDSLLFLLFSIPFILAFHWQVLLSNKRLTLAKIETDSANKKLQSHQNQLETTITERTKELTVANSQLKKLSLIDPLTQISNRRAYDDRLKNVITTAKQSNTCVSLLLVDIDYFKLFNDQYGHEAGDKALISVAEAINRSIAQATDMVARFGGEEFVILMESTDIKEASKAAEGIIFHVNSLGIKHECATNIGMITVSIGLAAMEGKQLNAAELFNKADSALYKAKKAGRNRYEVFKD